MGLLKATDTSDESCARMLKMPILDPGFEHLPTIHTIVYNRTFNPDNIVVAAYSPTSFQYSPGAYVAFTTASNDQLRFTPSTFYLNNLGFPYKEFGKSPPTDGIIRLETVVVESSGSADGFGIEVHFNPSCLINCH